MISARVTRYVEVSRISPGKSSIMSERIRNLTANTRNVMYLKSLSLKMSLPIFALERATHPLLGCRAEAEGLFSPPRSDEIKDQDAYSLPRVWSRAIMRIIERLREEKKFFFRYQLNPIPYDFQTKKCFRKSRGKHATNVQKKARKFRALGVTY